MAEPLESFVCLLRPSRHDFLETMTADEERTMGEHFAYLEAQLDRGRIVLAGPCTDGTFGIVVFHAAGMEEAAAMVAADPAVSRGVMTTELHPFRISLAASGPEGHNPPRPG